MPKSASTYVYRLVESLYLKGERLELNHVQSDSTLGRLISGAHNYVDVSKRGALLRMVFKSRKKNLIVKTHTYPNPILKVLLKLRLAKVIYLYRDPRDVIASVIDYAIFLKGNGRSDNMSQYDSFDKALKVTLNWCKIAEVYKEISDLYLISYEELSREKLKSIIGIVEYLGLEHEESALEEKMEFLDPQDALKAKDLKFNKGISGRYKEYFDQEQMDMLNESLEFYLKKWGYLGK